MEPRVLRMARQRLAWRQRDTARRLGVTQAYVSMLECGRRPLRPPLARKLARLYRLPASALPLPPHPDPSLAEDPQTFAELLARLDYPGFRHLRSRQRRRNPCEVLLAGLAQDNLEARAVEALPWLLLHYRGLETEWLVREAKLLEVQNRLGFVVGLARRVAEQKGPAGNQRLAALHKLEESLERCRLAREDNLCQKSLTEGEARWLREHRDGSARHWNLVTDWKPEHLRYVE